MLYEYHAKVNILGVGYKWINVLCESMDTNKIKKAVATKLAMQDCDVTIVNCEVKEEHPDNARFLKDCEEWFGQEIITLGNDKYGRSIDNVFKARKYLAGIGGAPCTLLLKKEIRIMNSGVIV